MRAGTAVVFCAIAGVLLWSQVAIAALSVCLNETPALFARLQEVLPISASSARSLLPLFGQHPVDPVTGAPGCAAAAPAEAMAIAGLAYLLGIAVLQYAAIPAGLRWLVIGLSAAGIQLALFGMPGLLSSDILDYASHGRVAAIHLANPYLIPPGAFPTDPFASQGAWPNVVTVYGPLWTDIDATITGLLASGDMVQLAFAYKVVGLASDLIIAGLIWWLAGRWRRLGVSDTTRTVAVAMWVWNPVVNLEIVGNAHNEGVMIVLVLLGFALLTLGLQRGKLTFGWLSAIICLGLAALVKFVPTAIGAIVAMVWLRRAATPASRVFRALILTGVLSAISIVVASPWLDSAAVAEPLVSLAAGGQRFKDPWQDAPAAWLTVRVVPSLGVPDDPATLRMDVARTMVWGVTRALFAVYVVVEGWFLWCSADANEALLLRRIATISVRSLLLAILLFVSQVYAWYFLWPLPIACLLGLREPWSRAAVVFGLAFLPAFYLREFLPYGVFYLPVYGLVALAVLGAIWAWAHVPVVDLRRWAAGHAAVLGLRRA
ncbi:MAG: hypothetical protein LC797_19165 [Chloroflexi bacterium]|nr:hypothetical protein [Chloroflexota bacterium]